MRPKEAHDKIEEVVLAAQVLIKVKDTIKVLATLGRSNISTIVIFNNKTDALYAKGSREVSSFAFFLSLDIFQVTAQVFKHLQSVVLSGSV